jgi:DNA-binding MarR family transcriptional regulator
MPAEARVKGLGYLQLRILQLLAGADDGMLVRDLIIETHATPGCVSSSLRLLRARGLVRRPHHGYWIAA